MLNAAELLSAWEQGLCEPPMRRMLTLLACTCDDMSTDALAQLSIGECDMRLFSLRERVIGPQLAGVVGCPVCAQQVELELSTSNVCIPGPTKGPEPCMMSLGEYDVKFRLPNMRDMVSIASVGDDATLKRSLLERCVLDARYKDQPVSVDLLSQEVMSAVSERMSELDPQVDIQLAVACPGCGHQWRERLDIMSFLWSEIHAWAVRLIRDVHTIALAYGWREADILAMSPMRREVYLELIGQ